MITERHLIQTPNPYLSSFADAVNILKSNTFFSLVTLIHKQSARYPSGTLDHAALRSSEDRFERPAFRICRGANSARDELIESKIRQSSCDVVIGGEMRPSLSHNAMPNFTPLPVIGMTEMGPQADGPVSE
ncbi:hypothetical protein [Mesorhizobium sp. M6A.T.Cr.TU.016.01.1.1]|uniref:hypothetical protein n=1 Tax=Mesorhizobium sp. M6A.T.Cr.TU.016.01.1.1 TaxID=2493677 RepID=UPI000F75F319|nr:hypothetical protein [Mesorhizobium sp. M6A.T.Cr.TU.016.01.1.1]AZO67997.1 hypothetical protein EJ075_25820 [Mesorhizobium sp. M6A.T.Cr.TU.016.01.1.1]